MVNIPSNFPSGCSDEELRKTLKDFEEFMLKSDLNSALRWAPTIFMGQNELNVRENLRRHNEEVVERKKNEEIAAQNNHSSLRLSRIGIGIAVIALLVSLYQGWQNDKQSKAWQQAETERLELILGELKTRSNSIPNY